ncbi:MAG: hypothetical protein ACR2N6_09615 [Miltoncostaeaceae bacterium]
MVSNEQIITPFWVRLVADERFREAVVDDPLRAMAGVEGVEVSAEQITQLDEMARDERVEMITEVVREAHIQGWSARLGSWEIRDEGGPEEE